MSDHSHRVVKSMTTITAKRTTATATTTEGDRTTTVTDTAMIALSILLPASGVATVNPSISSMVSRNADPMRQGAAMGSMQSLGALGRTLEDVVELPARQHRQVAGYIDAPAARSDAAHIFFFF